MAAPPKGKRAPPLLKVKYKSATVDAFIEQYALDLSRDGIFVKTAKPPAAGAPLKFEFLLQSGEPVLSGVGRVAWRRTQQAEPGHPPGMGLKFLKLSTESRAVVERAIAARGGERSRFEHQVGAELAPPTSPPTAAAAPAQTAARPAAAAPQAAAPTVTAPGKAVAAPRDPAPEPARVTAPPGLFSSAPIATSEPPPLPEREALRSSFFPPEKAATPPARGGVAVPRAPAVPADIAPLSPPVAPRRAAPPALPITPRKAAAPIAAPSPAAGPPAAAPPAAGPFSGAPKGRESAPGPFSRPPKGRESAPGPAIAEQGFFSSPAPAQAKTSTSGSLFDGAADAAAIDDGVDQLFSDLMSEELGSPLGPAVAESGAPSPIAAAAVGDDTEMYDTVAAHEPERDEMDEAFGSLNDDERPATATAPEPAALEHDTLQASVSSFEDAADDDGGWGDTGDIDPFAGAVREEGSQHALRVKFDGEFDGKGEGEFGEADLFGTSSVPPPPPMALDADLLERYEDGLDDLPEAAPGPAAAGAKRSGPLLGGFLLLLALAGGGFFAMQQGLLPQGAGPGPEPASEPAAASAPKPAVAQAEPQPTAAAAPDAAPATGPDAAVVEPPPKAWVSVNITSVPRGADIVMGGRVVGTTPTHLDLPLDREAEIAVRAPGYATLTKKTMILRRPLPVRFRLEPLPFVLTVETTPSGAEVQVGDRTATSPATLELGHLQGDIRVSVGKKGYRRTSRPVRLDEFAEWDDAMRATVTVNLSELPELIEKRERKIF